uniref:Uncharacterized protein n=1 Tax=Picea glauca TaxID=3330 RepID=A0A101LY89_PICGL|nr:hypothetical protein ABT39_MTgene5752 [Picea glauca]
MRDRDNSKRTTPDEVQIHRHQSIKLLQPPPQCLSLDWTRHISVLECAFYGGYQAISSHLNGSTPGHW